jgi:hypothetical protein
MTDLSDLQLDRGPEPDLVPDKQSRTKWIALGVMLLVVAGILGYASWRRTRSTAPASAAGVAQPDTAPKQTSPVLEGERIPLPPLPESDPLVRELVARLSRHPQVLAWLTTKGLIENFVVVTLNVSEGQTPVTHLKPLVAREPFRVKKIRDLVFLDPASYQRYDEHAAAIDGLDATGTARLYLTLKPRILDAYRRLGHPEGDFDPVLERATAVLLSTPVIDAEIQLREKVASYEFANQNLESLSAAQKQLLRMGPANTRIVQRKLQEIARLLGLDPRTSS